MQFKHTILALVAIGILPIQAYANEAQTEATNQLTTFSEADIQVMFEDTDKSMQLAALSSQEMKETEGAIIWAPYIGRVGIGFAGGFGGSAISQYYSTGQVDWGSAFTTGLYGAGIGGASRFLSNRGWY